MPEREEKKEIAKISIVKGKKMKEMEKKYLDEFCQRCGEISCTLNFNEALQSILDNVENCLDVQASALHLYDPAKQAMVVMVVKNLSKEYSSQGPVPLTDNPVDREVMKGKMITIFDAGEHPHFKKLAEKEGIRSILCAPLKSKDRPIGSLWLFTGTPRSFSSDEISYVTTLCSQGGIVLGNAKLYQSLHALSQIAKVITSRLDLKEVLQLIVAKAAQMIGGKGSSILLLNRKTGALSVSATFGLSEEFLKKGPVLANKSIKECLKQLVIIPDIRESQVVQYPEQLLEEGIFSILCTPLMVRGSCIGNLRVYLDHPRQFSTEDLELFQILSDFSGISIENARLFNHIKRDYEDLTQDVWQWYDWGKRSPKI